MINNRKSNNIEIVDEENYLDIYLEKHNKKLYKLKKH